MPPPPATASTTPTGSARPRLADVGRWLVLGSASGVLAGLACWAFLTALDHVTETRLDHPGLVWFLPLAGLAVGAAYHRLAGRAAEGNALLLDQIHRPTAWVPRRMAPLVGVGTLLSHLFGASVGREGTALQLSGSLTDWLARALGLRAEDRRILLMAALAGGFGATFGVPWAGLVFGLEVQRFSWHRPPRTRADGSPSVDRDGTAPGRPGRHARTWPWWVPSFRRLAIGDRAPRPSVLAGFRDGTWVLRAAAALAASFVGDRVVTGLGRAHEAADALHVGLDPALLARCALAGAAFGLAAIAFLELTDVIRDAATRLIPWAPARPAIGGVLVLVGLAVVGRSYAGLSLPLVEAALAGDATGWSQPALKLGFTALCLGTGFIGGEVTPLFVVGATLGAALAPTLGLPVAVGAAIGFVAVFGAAANTPITSTIVAVELFGVGALAPAAVACLVAYLCSGRRGLYATQLRSSSAGPVAVHQLPTLAERAAQRAGRRRRPPP